MMNFQGTLGCKLARGEDNLIHFNVRKNGPTSSIDKIVGEK